MFQPLSIIGSQEYSPNDWNLSVLCSIHKQVDPAVYANYRGISFLNIVYKVFSTVLCRRLKSIVNKLIVSYQCGFRPGKSTIDQIFTIHQILEKTLNTQIDTHQLFIDFKADFNSADRSCRFETMSIFSIPTKLILLCISKTICAVKIGENRS